MFSGTSKIIFLQRELGADQHQRHVAIGCDRMYALRGRLSQARAWRRRRAGNQKQAREQSNTGKAQRADTPE